LTAGHNGKQKSGNFVLDTGAQLSLMSSAMAFDLGLDTNGNGTLDDEAVGSTPIGGVGGIVNAPMMLFDEIRLPTDEGVELVFKDLQVAIVDIDPTIDGIFGMNLLSTGWGGSLFGELDDLIDLLNDAGLGDLLEELGLGSIGGEGAPFGYFDKAHFDFRQFDGGQGRIVLDLTSEVSGIVAPEGMHGDLDGDNDVDLADRTRWVHDVKRTYFGDSNLDRSFDARDLVAVFTAGEYEDQRVKNSTWAEGDWNADCEFDSRDLVLAFQDGGFERVAPGSVAVPEPSGFWLATFAVGLLGLMRRPLR
jgi:hypothetical protein